MDTSDLLRRAATAFARRDFAAAERDCRSALAATPGDPDAEHLLGLLQRQGGRLTEAEASIRRSVERAPRRAEFRVNFGNLLRATGRIPEAEQQYRIALQIEPGLRGAGIALARLLLDAGLFAPAEELARGLLARDARDAEAASSLGRALRGLARPTEAEAAFRQALALKPDYAAARHNLGALLGEQLRSEESLFELDRAAVLGAVGPALQFNRGRALLELGRIDEAEAALAQAVGLEPTSLESQTLLAKLRFMRGELDFARALAAAAAAEPAKVPLQLALGDLLRRAGRLPEAEALLRALSAQVDWSPQLAGSLAVLLQEQGRLAEAVIEARAAQAARPEDPIATENLISILIQLGDPEPAWPLILRERQRAPLDQRWLAYEASCSRLLGTSRHRELYDYERFVQCFDLEAPAGWTDRDAFMVELGVRLTERHRLATHPLDQSLRFGSQTARSLLVDPDPVIRAFIEALARPIAEYRRRIGDDARHPFTSRNHGDARLVGCWSVRLGRGGYHVNHVHPQGWISSACYVEVPAEVADLEARSGWLKFGEPRMPSPALAPEHFVQPARGRLALFPSYMWHGTMPIHGDEPRLTAAFDAVTSAG